MEKRTNFRRNKQQKGPRMVVRPFISIRQKLTFKVAASAISLIAIIGITFYFQFAKVGNTYAATSGDYRAVATGNWNSTSTWQTYNGSSWVAAGTTPTTSGNIKIQSPYT